MHRPSSILELANRVFGDPAKASDWLDRPACSWADIRRATCWAATTACAASRSCCFSSMTISGLGLGKQAPNLKRRYPYPSPPVAFPTYS